jgi:hypothetical protein
MKLGLGVLTYNRPHLLDYSLRKLNLAFQEFGDRDFRNGIEKFCYIDKHVNGEYNTDVQEVATSSMIDFTDILTDESKQDTNGSIKILLDKCFENNDAVILIEEDIAVTEDFWFYVMAGIKKYEKNNNIFSLSACSNKADKYNIDEAVRELHKCHMHELFNVYGLVLFKRSYEKIRENWPNNPTIAYDTYVSEEIKRNRLGYNVRPNISRANNMGFYSARYMPGTDTNDSRYLWWKNNVQTKWNSDLFIQETNSDTKWEWPL